RQKPAASTCCQLHDWCLSSPTWTVTVLLLRRHGRQILPHRQDGAEHGDCLVELSIGEVRGGTEPQELPTAVRGDAPSRQLALHRCRIRAAQSEESAEAIQ